MITASFNIYNAPAFFSLPKAKELEDENSTFEGNYSKSSVLNYYFSFCTDCMKISLSMISSDILNRLAICYHR